MASPTTQNVKIIGKTAGSSLTVPLQNLTNVSIANAFRNIGNWFQSIGSGSRSFKGTVMSNGVAAFGAITFSSFVADDTITINGTVLTGKTNPSGASQFAIGATDTITATNAAACINANSALKTVVVATSAAAVMTVTCQEEGLIGNLITLAISAHGSVSTAVSGGTDGTVTNLAKGLS